MEYETIKPGTDIFKIMPEYHQLTKEKKTELLNLLQTWASEQLDAISARKEEK